MLHKELTHRTIAAALKVHSALGPGLLESSYQACLHYELECAGLSFEHQVRLPISYRGVRLEAGYRIDFLVAGIVVVELKAVEKMMSLHLAQVLSYLKLGGYP